MTTQALPEVTVYWRPGCGFCHVLRRELDRAGVQRAEVDIWAHPEAAAFVRSVAWGNETVPTVVVGDRALVNPSAGEVLALLQSGSVDEAPDPGPGPAPGHAARMRGTAWVLAAGATWSGLALTHPTVTYHLAPLVVVLAWPVAARSGGRHQHWRAGLAPVVGGTLAAVAVLGGLAGLDALQGPALIGSSAIVESLLMVALGLVIALVLERPLHRRQGSAEAVMGSGDGCDDACACAPRPGRG